MENWLTSERLMPVLGQSGRKKMVPSIIPFRCLVLPLACASKSYKKEARVVHSPEAARVRFTHHRLTSSYTMLFLTLGQRQFELHPTRSWSKPSFRARFRLLLTRATFTSWIPILVWESPKQGSLQLTSPVAKQRPDPINPADPDAECAYSIPSLHAIAF